VDLNCAETSAILERYVCGLYRQNENNVNYLRAKMFLAAYGGDSENTRGSTYLYKLYI
jgi:hypothetical protein